MNEENKQTHITYQDYQKKINKKPSESIAIFASAFFILLLLFLGIAKQLSPDVDVTISDESSNLEETAEKTPVDERLKLLQMEDNAKEDNMFANELEEKVVIPEHKKPELQEEKSEEQIIDKNLISRIEKEANPKPEETASPAPKNVQLQTPLQQGNVTSKVVVGYYSTKEQAEVAKGIIAESGLNISPFVRNIGGAYTIQVGSYSSREKAQSVVNDLVRNNYPARIISD